MSAPISHNIIWEDYFQLVDGALYWKSSQSSSRPYGRRAGTAKKDGYREVSLRGRSIREHRIIYEICFGRIPEGRLIDHQNGDRSDNRPENLRLVDCLENTKNNAIGSGNSTGVIGVSWCKAVSKWRAQIGVNCRQIWLGHFDDFNNAVAARKAAERLYGFHLNHGRSA